MKIKAIRTRADYGAALPAIEKLMDAKSGTAEGERLDVLATLVDTYERTHFRLDLPDPVGPINRTSHASTPGTQSCLTHGHRASLYRARLSRRKLIFGKTREEA